MTTPTCPACGAKFSHDNQLQACKSCGLPDEARDRGASSVKAYAITAGLRKPRAGSLQRRVRPHGRSRGAPLVPLRVRP